MKLEAWQAGDRSTLERIAAGLSAWHSLRFPDFVGHYYGGSDHCHLWVLHGDEGDIAGVIGVERMPFVTPAGRIALGFGSNFHAFQQGAGGLLFLHWSRQCGPAMQFGGSADARRLVTHQKWTVYPGIQSLQINQAVADAPGSAWWNRMARFILQHQPLKTRVGRRSEQMVERGGMKVAAIPEPSFSSDLIPTESEFVVRFAPDAEYLNWRYRPGLPFARYHIFRITVDGVSRGYVVLNEQRHRVLVAHCDLPDPWTLAQGIFAALSRLCRGRAASHGVLLTTSNPVVQAAFQAAGFRAKASSRPLSIGDRQRRAALPEDTSEWLISEDWGDNGQRAPFFGADRLTGSTSARAA